MRAFITRLFNFEILTYARLFWAGLFVLSGLIAIVSPSSAERPNVLFIICDDLNDFVNGLGGQEGVPFSVTPNLERFAESAVSFTKANTSNPVCAPSRSSLFYGLAHQTSGCYFWEKWYERSDVAKNSFTMNRFFKENGYITVGSGKVNHHMWEGFRQRKSESFRINRDLEWDEFHNMTDYGPYWTTGRNRSSAMPDVPSPFRDLATSTNSTGGIDDSFGSFESAWNSPNRKEGEGFMYGGAPYWGAPFRYVSENDRDLTPDEKNAQWAIDQIKRFEGQAEPFFLAVGFVRPHTPLHAPQKYFDMFPTHEGGPVDQFLQSNLKANDTDDTFMHDVIDPSRKGPRYYRTLVESYDGDRMKALRAYIQAYLACVAAVDNNIGKVLDALNDSSLKENTVVVITSDHGFNLGEKDWVFKGSPWEESCRVPLLIRAPGVSQGGTKVDVPVSLLDIYPTLVDLCGLPSDNRMNANGAFLDGYSMRPLLVDPAAGEWSGPDAALTFIHNRDTGNGDVRTHHFSIRTSEYRYIRYADGQEELYDHRNDPQEWINIANSSPEITAQHRRILERMILDYGSNRNRQTGDVSGGRL